jgi:hypothetical protein
MTIDQNTPAPRDFLERSAVPLHFPQFRNSASLAHLAHIARGPRYVLVGGKAWYDPDDILAWLEANKRSGPTVESRPPKINNGGVTGPAVPKKRGRPTKFEQMKRRTGAVTPAFEG